MARNGLELRLVPYGELDLTPGAIDAARAERGAGPLRRA